MTGSARDRLESATWPHERAAEALHALALAAGLTPRERGFTGLAREDASTLAERLESAGAEQDLEVAPVQVPYAQADLLLERAAPALLVLELAPGHVRLGALLRGGRQRALLLAPDASRVSVNAADVRALWCAPLERGLEAHVASILDAAGLSSARRARARDAILSEHLSAVPAGGAWTVALPPGRPFFEQARRARLPWLAAAIAATGFVASALALASWIPLGRGALEGRLDPAWLFAWALLWIAALPLRGVEAWLQSLFGVRFGILLRRRLMTGATRLEPEAVRGEGAGALLGRVLESEALEMLLLGGGFVMVAALVDLALTLWVLSNGPSPALAIGLFGVWIAIAIAIGARHFRHTGAAARARLSMTQDLVERMVGQRTRLVQEPRERWHLGEDRLLEQYLECARATDKTSLALLVLVSGAWLVSGAVVLCGAFVAGAATPIQLAVGLGALIFGQSALSKLSGGLVQLSACAVAWRQVKPLFAAAERREEVGLPRAALRPAALRPAAPRVSDAHLSTATMLEARAISFRHAGRERAVLSNVDVSIRDGERVLVEGPSGGGKSTLASLLIGWRAPSDGLLLWRGLDRRTYGDARWRRHVSAAPQFHENHVFTGTLSFNLLLAAPPEHADELVIEARALEIASELGLSDLIARMPSGLRQIVGETGWQLSHGEKSRLFIARALLSSAPLVVLDESLAALDSDTARQVLDCVRRRARSLVVVAHP